MATSEAMMSSINEHTIQSIVVIDDDPDDFLFVRDALEQVAPDVSVDYIDTCDEAYRFKGKPVNLVLLDINMPRHDGFTWLKEIKHNGYEQLPVIMYTNSLSPLHIRRAYEEGATLYFVKPDNFSHLKQSLSQLLHLDWSDPSAIKEKYTSSGKFETFG